MRGFRLNGWQRIGIVLSVLGAVGAAIYVRGYAVKTADQSSYVTYTVCADAALDRLTKEGTPSAQWHLGDGLRDCVANRERYRNSLLEAGWAAAGLIALVPIPIAWLLFYLVLWTARWIRRGFQPAP